MALDKIVDSAQLDAGLASVADAIRTKGGTSAPLAFPSDYVSAIGEIPSGGGAIPLSGALAVAPRGTVSGDIVLDFPNCDLSLGRAFQGAAKASGVGPFKLTVKCRNIYNNNQALGRMNYFCYQCSAFETVEFQVSGQAYIETDLCLLQNNTALKTISGTPFALTQALGANYTAFLNSKVVDVRFYENKSAQEIRLGSVSTFSDATLVSIANALEVSQGAATLTLHSTPKGRLSSIVGTVSSVTRGAETYDKFTADANGTVTLQDFITTTKGWTLA